jgi:hypothetical protein
LPGLTLSFKTALLLLLLLLDLLLTALQGLRANLLLPRW